MCAARCLAGGRLAVQVMLVGDPLKVKGDALTHMRLMETPVFTPQLYSGWKHWQPGWGRPSW